MKTKLLAIRADWECPVCSELNRLVAPYGIRIRKRDREKCERCGAEFRVLDLNSEVGDLKLMSQLERKITNVLDGGE